MGEVVVLSEKLELLKKFVEARKAKLSDAYDWAENQRREFGFLAQPLRLTFNHGDEAEEGNGVIISLFYKEETGEALLRRDWEERNIVQYNIIVNIDEILRVAPRATRKMLDNGLLIQSLWTNN